jgi:hypothetical protein
MEPEEIQQKRQELDRLRERVRELERELAQQETGSWQATNFYAAYYATTGFMLGGIGALASLMFNVVGATLFGKHPLQLIRVYLTFPLGEEALNIDGGLVLAIGCCLYLATGMLFGVPFYVLLVRYNQPDSWKRRFTISTLLALGLWIINYYAILSWLQPWLIGGNWILREIPIWVAALTHLVYGWTLALLYPLGLYVPYRPEVSQT